MVRVPHVSRLPSRGAWVPKRGEPPAGLGALKALTPPPTMLPLPTPPFLYSPIYPLSGCPPLTPSSLLGNTGFHHGFRPLPPRLPPGSSPASPRSPLGSSWVPPGFLLGSPRVPLAFLGFPHGFPAGSPGFPRTFQSQKPVGSNVGSTEGNRVRPKGINLESNSGASFAPFQH